MQNIQISYVGGETDSVKPSISAQIKAEAQLARDGGSLTATPMAGMLRAAYVQLRKEGRLAGSFDDWVERIEDIDLPDEDADPLA